MQEHARALVAERRRGDMLICHRQARAGMLPVAARSPLPRAYPRHSACILRWAQDVCLASAA